MTRKRWITIAVVVLVVIALLAAAAASGVWLFFSYRAHRLLGLADEAFAGQQWNLARTYYAKYLTEHPDSVDILSKYADASSRITEDRRGALRDVARAYYQIALYDLTDDTIMRAIRFEEQHRFWEEMEYTASYFLRQRPDERSPAPGSLTDTLRYYRALALDRLGRQKDAIDAYSLLVDGKTSYVDAYGNLAVLLRQQGFAEQADTRLKEARERFPDHPHRFLQEAVALRASHALPQAEEAIQKALKRAPDDPDVVMEAFQIASAQHRWDAAAGFTEHAMAIAPNRPDEYLAAAFLLDRKGEADKAIELLSALDPMVRADSAELFVALAELQITNGRLEEARETTAAYQAAYPEHFSLFEYLAARELLARGQAAEAARKLATVVESNPDFSRGQFYLAVAYLQSNQNDLAQTVLETYLRNRPDDDRARGLWESQFGTPQSPAEIAVKATVMLNDPAARPENLIQMANGLIRSTAQSPASDSVKEQVRQLLDRAIQQDPSLPQAYQVLAEFLISVNDVEAAQSVFSRGEAAGVAKNAFAPLRAMMALKKDDLNAARARLAEDIARPDITHGEILRWANLFASRGQLDVGLEAINTVAQRSDDERRAELAVEQIALCTRSGDLDRAMALLGTLEPEIRKHPAAAARLNAQKLTMARMLLRNESGDDPSRQQKADALIQAVEQSEPDNAAARILRARLSLRRDPPDYANAQAAGEAVLITEPNNVEALLLLYDVASNAGRLSQALTYARKAATIAPPGSLAHMSLAEAQMRLQRYSEARDTLNAVLAVRPNDSRALELLVRAYGETGQAPEAKATLDRLERAVGNDPANANAIADLRACVAASENNWGDAERLFRTRYEADPDDLVTVQGLTDAIARQGRHDEAEQILKQYTERRADNPDAWALLGNFYLVRADHPDFSEASSAFTRALLLAPSHSAALRGQIEVQLGTNHIGTALSLCTRYLAEQPDDVAVLRLKAILLSRESKTLEEALQVIERAIQLSEQPEFFSIRGTIRLALGKYADAVADIQRYADAAGRLPSDLDAAMAEAYLGLRELDLARQYYDSAKQKAAQGGPVDNTRLERVGKRLEQEAGKP